jgi:diguanylate cyclase (GGDEF)-like protein
MSRVAWCKILIVTVSFAGSILSAVSAIAPDSSQAALGQEIAAVTERVHFGPREAIDTLVKIQAAHAPLSSRHQALVYEQLSQAKFFAKDFAGALQAAKLLEALGKQQHDDSVECLGVLSQVYAYWMMGKIQTAYDLLHQAERFSPSTISTTARVKTLLTTAQMESEEHQTQAALRTVDAALRLARASQDDALLFMATKTQASLALAANELELALAAADQLLSLAMRSPYRERLVRAKAVEYAVASAAGQTSRASDAMLERIRLMRQLHLDDMLGRTLLDYSGLQLTRNRYADAAALAGQALSLAEVAADEQLANRAHFNRAIAIIHLGKVLEGKAEVERLFKASRKRAQLLAYLPEYVAALTQAGEVDASVQAGALRQQIEAEEALQRAKEEERARGQLDSRARDSQLKALEALNVHGQRNVWLAAAVSTALGLIGLLFLYGRLRLGHRLLEETNRQLFTSSNRDALTGLFNRRYVQSYVEKLARRGADRTSPAADGCGLVLLMDIDHFKQLNDTYGHAVGDKVLQATAERLSALFRNEDVLVRWGGEEFLALLSATQASEAGAVAARVLAAVSATPVMVSTNAIHLTISVGICRFRLALKDREMNWEEVVNMADQALYLAKQNGRNMAYGVTEAANATSVDMAQGLRVIRNEGKIALLEVCGQQR